MVQRDTNNPSSRQNQAKPSSDAAQSRRQAASGRSRLASLPTISEAVDEHPGRENASRQTASKSNANTNWKSAMPVIAGAGDATAAHSVGTDGAKAKKKRSIWNVVFYVALVVFVASLLSLGYIYYSYWKERSAYSDIAGEVFDVSANTLADLKVDWDALRGKNPETVAWIYVPDTQINYPVVHTSNNDKYLKTNFQGETNWVTSVGAIFLETKNSISFTDDNSIIYGHNMNDGSMFSVIADFSDPSVFNAHREVYVLTPSGNYRIKTFSLIHTSGNDEAVVQTMFGSASDLVYYINDKIERSVVSPAEALPAVDGMNQIFTFSTCDNNQNNARYILFGYVAESTVPGVEGLEEQGMISRNATSIVGAGANSFAEGNDVE
ncbi:MAG: class B sortase [Eggerthellaceae bacterium]|nr:class B sortase [Eggerthellaceae bacterium]